jgi:hypothetical protein
MFSYSPYQITKISTGTIDFKITVEKTNRKNSLELLRQFFFILFILIHSRPLFFITNNKDRDLRFAHPPFILLYFKTTSTTYDLCRLFDIIPAHPLIQNLSLSSSILKTQTCSFPSAFRRFGISLPP